MLNKGRLSRKARYTGEEADPMQGVANLADIMLVFACGLMVAIILNWNVDLSKNKVQILDEENLQEVEDPEEAIRDDSAAQAYEEKGVVYEDPETGKMYVIMPREE